jgi:hypothetical protein
VIPDLGALNGHQLPKPQALSPGVPILGLQIGAGRVGTVDVVVLHISTPAGVLACHIPSSKIEDVTKAMRAAASGITLADG